MKYLKRIDEFFDFFKNDKNKKNTKDGVDVKRWKSKLGDKPKYGTPEFDEYEDERFKCSDCKESNYEMYMVNDELWDQFGEQLDTLCVYCLEKRLGRKLTKEDFKQFMNSPVNQRNNFIKNITK